MADNVGEKWLQQHLGKTVFCSFTGGFGDSDGVRGTLVEYDDKHLTLRRAYAEQDEQIVLVRHDRMTHIF